MTDTAPQPGGQEQPAQQTEPQQQGDPWADPESAKSEIEKLRKENAGWRTKLREVEPLAAKAKELEEANKSEVTKAQEKAAAAEAKAQEAELRAARTEVAHAHGLSASQAKRLVGSTREELEADAKELAKDLAPPKADLKQGVRGKPADGDPDSDAWLRRMAGRR